MGLCICIEEGSHLETEEEEDLVAAIKTNVVCAEG